MDTKVTVRERGSHAWKHTRRGLIREMIYVAVGGGLAVVAVATSGEPSAVSAELIVALSAVGAAILVPSIEYVVRFIRAPRRILESRIDVLDKQFSSIEHERDAAVTEKDSLLRKLADTRPKVYVDLQKRVNDWIIVTDNTGAPGTFFANVRLTKAPAGFIQDPTHQYALQWEKACAPKTRIGTGGKDWVRLVHMEWRGVETPNPILTVSLYKEAPEGSGARMFCNRAFEADDDFKIQMTVVIDSEPSAFSGPFVLHYELDRSGIHAQNDD